MENVAQILNPNIYTDIKAGDKLLDLIGEFICSEYFSNSPCLSSASTRIMGLTTVKNFGNASDACVFVKMFEERL